MNLDKVLSISKKDLCSLCKYRYLHPVRDYMSGFTQPAREPSASSRLNTGWMGWIQQCCLDHTLSCLGCDQLCCLAAVGKWPALCKTTPCTVNNSLPHHGDDSPSIWHVSPRNTDHKMPPAVGKWLLAEGSRDQEMGSRETALLAHTGTGRLGLLDESLRLRGRRVGLGRLKREMAAR